MSVVDFIAEVFNLPTREMYDEVIEENLELQRQVKELEAKADKSQTPYIKVEENIFRYFKKYIVRVIHHKKRYFKSFDTLEDARRYLQEVRAIE